MRKKLLMTIAISLACTLCYGCGNTASTEETPTTEENVSTEETTLEEVETTEEKTQEDIEMTEEIESQDIEEETETVYLLSKSTSYDADGNIIRTEDYTYDEVGRKLTLTIQENEETKNIVYNYDFFDDGSLKKETALNDNSILYENEYDSEGNNIRNYSTQYGAIVEYEYTYKDGVKNTGITTYYNEDGTVSSRYDYVFNELGDKIEENVVMYNDDGSELFSDTSEYVYEYNSDNLPIVETCIYSDGSGKSIDTKTYDSQGNIVEEKSEIVSADGTIDYSYTHTYKFDSHNNEINSTSYDENGAIDYYLDHEITYDSEFNIIKGIYTDENGLISFYYENEYISMELVKTE